VSFQVEVPCIDSWTHGDHIGGFFAALVSTSNHCIHPFLCRAQMQDLHDPAPHDGCRGKGTSPPVSVRYLSCGQVLTTWPTPQEASLLPSPSSAAGVPNPSSQTRTSQTKRTVVPQYGRGTSQERKILWYLWNLNGFLQCKTRCWSMCRTPKAARRVKYLFVAGGNSGTKYCGTSERFAASTAA
jgi:hypothetical protein